MRANVRIKAASRRRRPDVYSGEYVETTSTSALSSIGGRHRRDRARPDRLFKFGHGTDHRCDARSLEPFGNIGDFRDWTTSSRASSLRQACDVQQRGFGERR